MLPSPRKQTPGFGALLPAYITIFLILAPDGHRTPTAGATTIRVNSHIAKTAHHPVRRTGFLASPGLGTQPGTVPKTITLLSVLQIWEDLFLTEAGRVQFTMKTPQFIAPTAPIQFIVPTVPIQFIVPKLPILSPVQLGRLLNITVQLAASTTGARKVRSA